MRGGLYHRWASRSVSAIAIASIASSLALTSIAFAQAHDPVAAEALFHAGRTLVDQGKYAEACPKFDESEKLDPAAGTLINLADCNEHVGKLAVAWEEWQEALDMLAPGDDRIPETKRRFAAIDARVPRLVLHLTTPSSSARVVRDGVDLGGAFDVPLPMDPGKHAIHIVEPSHDDATYDVTLAEKETKKIDVAMGKEKGDEGVVTKPKPPIVDATPSDDPGASRRKIAWIVGGVGVVALGVGVVGGLVALHDKSVVDGECPSNACSQKGYDAAQSGHKWATVSTIATIGGVAAIGVSIVLLVTAPHATTSTSVTSNATPTSVIAPTPIAGGAALIWTRSF
jgi:hypothetical protein